MKSEASTIYRRNKFLLFGLLVIVLFSGAFYKRIGYHYVYVKDYHPAYFLDFIKVKEKSYFTVLDNVSKDTLQFFMEDKYGIEIKNHDFKPHQLLSFGVPSIYDYKVRKKGWKKGIKAISLLTVNGDLYSEEDYLKAKQRSYNLDYLSYIIIAILGLLVLDQVRKNQLYIYDRIFQYSEYIKLPKWLQQKVIYSHKLLDNYKKLLTPIDETSLQERIYGNKLLREGSSTFFLSYIEIYTTKSKWFEFQEVSAITVKDNKLYTNIIILIELILIIYLYLTDTGKIIITYMVFILTMIIAFSFIRNKQLKINRKGIKYGNKEYLWQQIKFTLIKRIVEGKHTRTVLLIKVSEKEELIEINLNQRSHSILKICETIEYFKNKAKGKINPPPHSQ